MSRATKLSEGGPFRADQIAPGSHYELSEGHAILCAPTGGRGSRSNLVGASVLETDPAVESAGVDTGFSPSPKTLRAPDVAVGNVPDAPGWTHVAPPLAVEYADTGQDEEELQARIRDLLAHGTRYIWVVRLVGVRRVEVYEAGATVRTALPGTDLVAPGILQNPVRVEALYDREAAHDATLTNLLQRRGFASLEAVRAEGEIEGEIRRLRRSILDVLAVRGVAVPEHVRARVMGTDDIAELERWFTRAVTAASADDALSG